ncbi:MAG: phospholipid carrier-dependent glycosyltransferase [Planctomycetes bacterium]|nr:phospholipid carrier-dependent glycosyltransferase [Planctomycetota bacterium]
MFTSAANLTVALASLLLSVGVGNLIVNVIGLRSLAGRERVAFAMAVGLMALGLGTFAMGHAGLLHPWLFRAASGLAFLFAVPSLLSIRSHLAGQNLIAKFLECTLFEKVLIVLIFAQASAMLLTSLAPPIGADALAYHLAVPKIYISHRAIVDLPNHKHAAQPFLMEMIFLWGMLVKSDVLAQLLNFAATCAAGGSIYLLARRFFSRRAGIIATAVFMLTPQLFTSVGLMGAESAMTFFIMLTFIALARWAAQSEDPTAQRARVPWLILISLLAAGVAGMKQSGAGHVLFIAPAVVLIPLVIFRERLLRALRYAALYAAIAAVLGGGWYLRSYTMTGNPVYPYRSQAPFSGISEGREGMGKTFAMLLAYPWNITVNARRFGMLATDTPGPLPLAFVPLLLFVLGPTPRPLKFMLAYTAAFAGAIFFTSQLTRYLIPILGFTSIAAAVAIERMEKIGKLPALAAVGAVIVSCVVQTGLSARTLARHNAGRLRVIAGQQSRTEFLSSASYSYDAFQFLNVAAPPQSRVMLMYGHEAYYLDLPYLIAGFSMGGSPLTTEDYDSEAAFVAAVRRLEVDYIYVDEYVRTLFYRHRMEQYPHVPAMQQWFLKDYCRLVFQKQIQGERHIRIYKIIDRPTSPNTPREDTAL